MNEPTQHFIDPRSDVDLRRLDCMTRDTKNGDVIHIKAGTRNVLSPSLGFATYDGPADAEPLVIRGASDDGDGTGFPKWRPFEWDR